MFCYNMFRAERRSLKNRGLIMVGYNHTAVVSDGCRCSNYLDVGVTMKANFWNRAESGSIFHHLQLFRPQASSSGIPELIGFLNGTVVRHIFNVKTLLIKFLSCVLAVAAGMPIGPEGPMIHMGYALSFIFK